MGVKRLRAPCAMAQSRAKHFPGNARAKILDWDIYCCDQDHVHFELNVPGRRPVCFAVEPEDAHDLLIELTQATDQALGI